MPPRQRTTPEVIARPIDIDEIASDRDNAMETAMPAYAVGILHDVRPHPDIVSYLENIDATLAPFGGRFIVHGGEQEVREGDFNARLVVIEFADLDAVRAWYDSQAYRAILPLRADHSKSVVFFADGIAGHHVATDVLKPRVRLQET